MKSPFALDSGKWIDKRGKQRELPMQVLCVGLCRTGTASLALALEDLGYKVLHGGVEVWKNPRDAMLYREAVEAKLQDRSGQIRREYWDALWYDRNAVLDLPGNLYAKELIELYPGAKVILTVRDPEKWYDSCMNTIYSSAARESFLSRLIEVLDPTMRVIMPMLRLYNRAAAKKTDFWDLSREEGLRLYSEHLTTVKEATPSNRLLVYDVKDGWSPLCKFLGKPVPTSDSGDHIKSFPKVNDTASFTAHFGTLFLRTLLLRLAQAAGTVLIVGVALYLAQSRYR